MKSAKEILQGYANRQKEVHLTYDIVLQAMEEYANQYKELLSKYIQHVEALEGVNFLSDYYSGINFTEQELKLLKELADQPLPEKP